MSRRTASRALLAVALSVSLVACGDAADDDAASSESRSSAAERSEPAEPSAQECESSPATAEPAAEISTDLAEKPEVPGTDAAPPCDLVISDVVVGTGAEAVAGTTVAVKYVGAFYETGEEFDSSWSRGAEETLPVPLGAGRVIPGFEEGLTGMQVGGRRVVTIPSELGYGPRGQGPIPPDATLVFVMDLVEVTP
jgi:peptidylprolyl isomerase